MPTFPISIPYTFQLQTTSIPLSELDTNFSTVTAALNGVASGSYALGSVNITGGTVSGLSTPLGVASGGTGASTLAANSLLVGNGTSTVSTLAPGASGNVLQSNGTSWVSTSAGSGTVSSVATGFGLSGGPITTSGTISANNASGAIGVYSLRSDQSTSSYQSYIAGNTYTFGSTTARCLSAIQFSVYDSNIAATTYMNTYLFIRLT